MDLPFPTDLQAFIAWLAQNGTAGVLLALIAERIPAFKNWKHPAKGYVVIAAFVGLPFLAISCMSAQHRG